MSSNIGFATLDFGAAPGTNEATYAVTTETAISSTSKAEAWVMGEDTTSDHTASDHRFFNALAGITCGTPTTGVGFTIYATSTQKLTGTYFVRWVWSD